VDGSVDGAGVEVDVRQPAIMATDARNVTDGMENVDFMVGSLLTA